MSRRYGKHETIVEVDSDWATMDVTVHWTLDSDDHQDLVSIDKITVLGVDLHERWNEDYFYNIINDEVLAGADYHWTDHGD